MITSREVAGFDARKFGCLKMPACSYQDADTCGHHGRIDTKPLCDAPICDCICHKNAAIREGKPRE
jgi:hypothetical protein